jgi:hypothetical protein
MPKLHVCASRAIVAALSLFAFGTCAALADPWVMLVQPPPWSRTPPPYDRWQPLQQFDTLEECIDARLTLHYQYWASDEDLSHRALEGVCRDQATGRIATDFESSAAPTPGQGFNCYAPDEGAANPNRAGHYNWAQARDSAALKAGLDQKLRALFGCRAKSDAELAAAFADMSVVVAHYVTNAACFHGDGGAVGTDWSLHRAWAARRSREAMLAGAQGKMLTAVDCLDRACQLDYFADISVVMARHGSSS